ncbi:MAG: restriction endonuclease subunit S, partial [Clostridia bacterium]|nr:restriction endonuclease subunit S [Clostridia bacterium]
IFIHYWFSFFQAILEAQAPESAQKNINLKVLSELEVIVPSIEEQMKFVSFVVQTDKSKLEIQKGLEKLELLKKALMQKYFG